MTKRQSVHQNMVMCCRMFDTRAKNWLGRSIARLL